MEQKLLLTAASPSLSKQRSQSDPRLNPQDQAASFLITVVSSIYILIIHSSNFSHASVLTDSGPGVGDKALTKLFPQRKTGVSGEVL